MSIAGRNEVPGGDAQTIAEDAAQTMLAHDVFSRHLGLRLVTIGPGVAQVGMTVRRDLQNGLGVCHGGIIFSLADTAFACACNSWGVRALAASATIDYVRPSIVGDELTAIARVQWQGKRTGLYETIVNNQHGDLVALFRGRSVRPEHS